MKSFYFFIFSLLLISQSFYGQAPTMNCPGDITVNNAIGFCGETVAYTIPTCATNCGGETITQTDGTGLTSGDFFPLGTNILEYTITSAGGSSICSFNIIVVDAENPSITCLETQTLYVNNDCKIEVPDYTTSANVSDNCDMNPTITQIPLPNSVIFVNSPLIIALTAEDASGNKMDCDITVTLIDTISPTITCPAPQNVSASAGCTATLGDYTSSATITDNCDSSPLVTQSPVAGTTITTSQEVTLTATDASGNTATCSFLVIVDDSDPPTITCPSNETVFVDGNCEYVLPDYTGSLVIVDNCDNNPTILQNPALGEIETGVGPVTVSFTVTDLSDNIAVCSFQLAMVDTIAPVLTCPADQTDFLDANCEFRALDYATLVTGVDNCGDSYFTQTPSANTLFAGTNSPIVIAFSAEDIYGNTSTCNFDVNILDTIAPIVTECAPDTIISADANCEYVMGDFTGFITAIDNCSATTVETQDVAIGTAFAAGGPYPIILSITDDFNNAATCPFNITVVDNSAPEINCPNNSNVAADNNCEYLIPSYDTILNITDECSSFTYSQSIAAGTILSGISSTQDIAILVADLAGNSNSCTFTITIIDTLAPIITCPGDQTLDINIFCQYTLPDFSGLVVASDFCDPAPVISQSLGIGLTLDSINTITMTAQDSSGNIATCTFNVIPNDTVAPTIICPNNDSTCNDVFTFIIPIGADDCGNSITAQTDSTGLTSGDSFPIGTTTLEYTVTDLVGNTTTCAFDLKVFAPVILFAGTSVLIDEGDSTVIDATLSNGENILWTPDYNMDNDTILNPTVAPTEPVNYYTIYTTSADGCSATDSVLILVNTIDSLEINNFLSPNGDFTNDKWTVNKPSLISGCPLAIYNRWGKIVWESTSYENNFDGTNESGEPLPEGTYFYLIKCAQEEYKGSILLMR